MLRIIEEIRKRDVCNIVLFDEATILHKTIEEWPMCEYLLCFESGGFPLEKGISLSFVVVVVFRLFQFGQQLTNEQMN